jgi:membrane protein
MKKLLGNLDTFQQRHRAVALPVATFKRFGEHGGGRLASTVSYWSFFSIFPLMLAFVTVLNIVLEDRPDTRQDLLDGALGQVPLIASELGATKPIGGSTTTVVIGLLTAIWSGMAAASALQASLYDIADVPELERPNGVSKRLRSFAFLVVLAAGITASTLATNLAALFNSGIALEIVGIAIALVVNVGIFLFAFGVMTRSRQGWLEMLPGAIAASVAVVVLLRLGTFIVGRYITGASDTYGTFAVVIALLSWFYLVSRIILLGAELNGVLANELWPRSITADSDLTTGDRRAVTLDAGRNQRDNRIEIAVTEVDHADTESGEDPEADPADAPRR